MELEIKYRGKLVTGNDIGFINRLISDHPEDSRRALSKRLCLAWNWVQPNGTLRDMVCRGLMLQLHRAGHIRLPEKRSNPHNPFIDRKKPEKVDLDQSPIYASLSQLGALT